MLGKNSFGFWLHCSTGHTMEGAESVLYVWLLFGRNEHARCGFRFTIFHGVEASQYGEHHYLCAREKRLEDNETGLHSGMERR